MRHGRWLAAVALFSISCAGNPSRLHTFKLVDDPTAIVVWGLVFAHPTERVKLLTPLLEPIEALGGVGLDSKDKVLFTANFQGVYSAVRVRDQETLWRHSGVDPLSMPPTFVSKESVRSPDDLVIFGSQNGRVFAVNAQTGATVWTYEMGGEISEAPTVAEGRLLIMNSRNQLMALDALTGKWLWQYTRDFPVGLTILGHSGVAVKADKVFVGFSDGFLACVQLDDGLLQWSRPLTLSGQGFADADATPIVVGDRVYASSVHDGVYALKADTGDVIWQLRAANVTRLTAQDPTLFALSASGKLQAIDADSGKPRWELKFPTAVVSKPVAHRGYIAFGAKPGGLYVVDVQTGRLVQRFFPGGVASELAVRGGSLAFMSEGSVIYYMRYGEKHNLLLDAKRRYVGL
ncbi:MAG: PQQ-binding-like beta-propeller repeat protein [Deltaproteobacteria bacterium]|nr:PQQ-binding-like beta-propeller repeat protein [Deltaproteobacteria bacterium]